jgi:hypothetical protein
MKRIAWLVLSLGFIASPLFAQNGTTTGSCTNNSYPRVSFTTISVECAYSGDANNDNAALVEYTLHNAGAWFPAYAPFIDKRAVIASDNPNQHYHEARESIVGLTANTAYDVRITWIDGDGVAGTNPVVMTNVITNTFTPPLGGSARTATDDSSLQALTSGAATLTAGDTITVSAGNYSPFTINRSVGNAGAWVKLVCGTPLACHVSGVGATNINVSANFWWITGFDLTASDGSAIRLGTSANHVLIENNTLDSVSTLCAGGTFPTTHYGDAGIGLGASDNNIYLRNNTITASAALSTPACTCSGTNMCNGGSNIYDSPAAGVSIIDNSFDISVDGNNVVGGFRDAITVDDAIFVENVEMRNNYVEGYKDDGIEIKGYGPNNRMEGNIMYIFNSAVGAGGFGETCMAPTGEPGGKPYGPMYIYRNTCRVGNGYAAAANSAWKTGGQDPVPLFYFHNSVELSQSSSNWDIWVNAGNLTQAANNITTTKSGHIITNGTNTINTLNNMLYQYNMGWIKGGDNTWAKSWTVSGVTSNYGTNGDPGAAPSFQAIGQELNTKHGNPIWTNLGSNTQALQITNTSGGWNAGLALNNFNGANSAWPLSSGNSNPNMGAYEASADVVPPVVGSPSTITVSNISATGVTLTWNQGTDNVTPPGSLVYKSYYSLSSNISTVANMIANGTLASTDTGVGTTNISGLTCNTAYFFNIALYDQAGLSAPYTITGSNTTSACAPPPPVGTSTGTGAARVRTRTR